MRTWLVAAASLLLLFHLWQFRDFTVDDALISYSYSQNLVQGNGLVNVAGGERVEAYTNFLWVICVAAGMIFSHDGILVGRILAALAALALLIGVAELFAALRGRRSPLDALPALFIAMLMPISYWTMSGLESGLYMALGVWCAVRLIAERDGGRPWSALLAAALALTRPDGILLLLAAAVVRLVWDRRPRWYLMAFLPVAAHFGFRYLYYAWPLPNSFYVKARALDLRQLWIGGRTYLGIFADEHHLRLGGGLMALSLLGVRRWYARLVTWSLFLALLAFPFYARGDWMAEGRFAAPLLPLFVVLACDGVEQLVSLLVRRRPRSASLVSGAVLVLLAGLLAPVEREITLGRRGRYPAPAHWVVDRAQEYLTVARALEIEPPFSVADGDLGGTSWVNGFRVLDLGGLGDIVIAHQYGQYTAFREHVLGEERPTFFRLQGFWARFRFPELPEFAEEYLPLPLPEYGQGFSIARSAFLDRGWDTRRPVHLFDADGLDLIAADVGPRELRLWLLVRRAPATPLVLKGAADSRTLAVADFPSQSWRAGEILRIRSVRRAGALQLCGRKECIALADGHSGASPPALPPEECPRGNLSQELYDRGLAAKAAGDNDRAHRDLWQSLRLDRSRAFARRHLEEVRLRRSRPWSPQWRIRLLAAERQFALVPDEEHFAVVASAALAAGECEAALRLQVSTGLVPEGDAARLDLAECDLRAGRPSLGLPLLVEPDSDAEAARVVAVAFAAGAREKAQGALQRLHRRSTPVAPGLTLVDVWVRPLRDGSVELSLALERNGEAPNSIDVGGMHVPFDRPPRTWEAGEIFEHRVRLDVPPGKRRVAVGSAFVEIVNHAFSEDFELGRADGWNGRPKILHGPRWGIEGSWYAAGDLISPPLQGDEVCFVAAGRGEAAVELAGRRLQQVLGNGDEIFRLRCLSLSPGARLVTRQISLDDVQCSKGGRPLPCAGEVEVE